MPSLQWFLPLAVGIALLSPGSGIQAQEGGKCLTFRSSPIESGSPFREGSVWENPGRPSFYVSSEGEVCSTITPPLWAPLPGQSAVEQVPGPGRPFLLSAILPGMGQRVLGLDRWIAYLAAEGWAWTQFLARRGEGRDLQNRYKELAWLVARRVSSGPRVDGSFEYYEALTQYNASGAYDSDPDLLGIQPEGDPETYNGTIWLLTRQIFFLDDPEAPVEVNSDEYKNALRYYISRAYTPDLAWNWSSNTLQQAEFAGLIRSSDENLRRSTTMVGFILANHLLSAVDALVSARIGQVTGYQPSLELSIIPGPFRQDTFRLAVRIHYQ